MTSPTNFNTSNPFGNSTIFFPGIDDPFEFETRANTGLNESTASTSSEGTNPSPMPPTPESKEDHITARSYRNLRVDLALLSRKSREKMVDLTTVPLSEVPVTNMTDKQKNSLLLSFKIKKDNLTPGRGPFHCGKCHMVFRQYGNFKQHHFCITDNQKARLIRNNIRKDI